MLRMVAKRLLVLPITLLGVTLLVFVLVAGSPGGLEGDEDVSLEARISLHDRYGLDDPLLVQYGRWLAQVCPVKLGHLPQTDVDGRMARPPREPAEPPALALFAPEGAPAGIQGPVQDAAAGALAASAQASNPSALAPDSSADARLQVYRAASRAHAGARRDYLLAREKVLLALHEYARACGIAEAAPGRELPAAAVQRLANTPRPDLPQHSTFIAAGTALLPLYERVRDTRADVIRALEARPLPAQGVAIIPGVLGIAWPDFGHSLSRRQPVTDVLAAALPRTLLLNGLAIPLTYLIAIPGGVLAAVKRGSWFDSALGLLFTTLWSIPVVWAAVLGVGYLSAAPPRGIGWFPVSGLHGRGSDDMAFLPGFGSMGFEPGYILDTLWHTVLPVLCLTYASLATLANQARSATLESLGHDFVRTARAKGVPPRQVISRHVLRNSLLPMITLFVGIFPALLSGTVIVERVFGIQGMGSLVISSYFDHDREVLLAVTAMIAAVNVLALLLADVLYMLADPRVRIGGSRAGGSESGGDLAPAVLVGPAMAPLPAVPSAAAFPTAGDPPSRESAPKGPAA